jgi:DNA-binding XRE family transcriptional regulator
MSYIINSNSIRAARALLDWTQEGLASQAGLTQATIANLEIGKHTPSKTTSILLKNTFEKWGVEVLPDGARLVKGIREITGPDAAKRVMEEAYEILRNTTSELLIFGADERQHRAGVAEVSQKIRNAGIRIRLLVSAGNRHVSAPVTDYRSIPDHYFLNSPILIFGDRLGVFIPNEKMDIIQVLSNPVLAESQRRLFNFVWDSCSNEQNHLRLFERPERISGEHGS